MPLAVPCSPPVPRSKRIFLAVAVSLFGLLLIASIAILASCSGYSSSRAVTPATPTGVVVGSQIGCPGGFFSNGATAVCHQANIAGCPGASNLNFVYSYDNPGSPKGTIVFFTGGGGNTDPGDQQFAADYFAAGFEVVQVQWAFDWEYTTIPPQFTGNNDATTHTPNAQLAACRI